jgi:hypothetical protein
MSNKKVTEARKYVFKDGSRISGVKPQVVGDELDRINNKHGALRPADIVDESRPDDAALHPAFEWNDEIAAEEWRIHTARNIIRSVQVITEENNHQTVYVNVKQSNGERNYQPMSVVVNSPDLYAMAVYQFQQRINAAKESLAELENAANKSDADQMQLAAIKIAMQALATASDAVQSLH